MVMGRPNKGVGHVDNCVGSEQSKQRMQVILRTLGSELSVDAGCEILGIQRPQFARLRLRGLQGAVDALEPGRPGRKPQHAAAVDPRVAELESEVAELKSENAELRRELRLERVRADVALLLPGRHGDQKGGATTRQARRKTERERRRRARSS